MSPPTASTRWSAHFTVAACAKGAAYFRGGKVSILSMDAAGVEAEVVGGRPYEVFVGREDDRTGGLNVYCTCPAFSKFGPCKHLWAVLLELEERGELPDGKDGRPSRAASRPRKNRSSRRPPAWRSRIESLRDASARAERDPWKSILEREIEIDYVIDAEESEHAGLLVVEAFRRLRKRNGEWGARKPYDPRDPSSPAPTRAVDRRVLARLGGVPSLLSFAVGMTHGDGEGFVLDGERGADLLPLLCETGRLVWTDGIRAGGPLRWDDGEPWYPEVAVRTDGGELVLAAELVRGEERMDVAEPRLLLATGLLVTTETAARFDPRGAHVLLADLRARGPLRAPASGEGELVATAVTLGGRAFAGGGGLEWSPPETPQARLLVEGKGFAGKPPAGARLDCRLSFDYGGTRIEPEDAVEVFLRASDRRLVRRDLPAEEAALRAFLAHGGRRTEMDARRGGHGTVAARRLGALVRALLAEGWIVEAEGKLWRSGGSLQARVRSGTDWFDLEGGLRFGDQLAPFPELLAALRTGRDVVRLGDGSVGVLPEDWLERWGLLELAGRAAGEGLRFARHQGWLLDALLTEREGVETDAGFARHRERLASFRGIEPVREPRGFRGELRAYQREGLGWFRFLEELGLGGCLADDMGLGKTVQVLALLEARREKRGGKKGTPSLVVAPRSVVFNWIDEAARFAPRLRVLDWTGGERKKRAGELDAADLVVTTYGTLRRDVVDLKDRPFDCVILDEAQAIKNAASQSAKAARLLRAECRLALSGTPIENSLSELWSLFEFLNQGMLGRSGAFRRFLGNGKGSGTRGNGQAASGRGLAPSDLEALARAIRPFFLRRTKEEVLRDLPEKTEQTIGVELRGAERRRYDELRAHYRASLLERESEVGIDRMKIHVLEALLRLRQCACHPALLDPDRSREGSAKLEALLPRLEEIAAEGNKALVFSQFTRFLALVRARLDEMGLPYEYLDGRTRKRREKVERFQSDPRCPLFLVSLKAGGHGLNLTAAGYVFLLDPWWNPAVEAQAVDRAHRIGQTRPVFAYRLLARDTVEEKVLALQQEKRELAAALLGGGSSTLRGLTRRDLERLFS